MKTTMKTDLLQKLTPPKQYPKNEGVGRMENENDDRKIEGMEYETEVMESDNEVLDNKVLPPEKNVYPKEPSQFQLQLQKSHLRFHGMEQFNCWPQ